MHRAKGDRLVRASGLPVRQCITIASISQSHGDTSVIRTSDIVHSEKHINLCKNRPFCGTYTNSADSDQTPKNAPSDECLHSLLQKVLLEF